MTFLHSRAGGYFHFAISSLGVPISTGDRRGGRSSAQKARVTSTLA
jgi:hypothetical protein